jgi:hypothetical protein
VSATACSFERERFLSVVSMDEASAKAFAMPGAVKAVCAGQADAMRYKFGARIYYLFQTWDDYNAWTQEARS